MRRLKYFWKRIFIWSPLTSVATAPTSSPHLPERGCVAETSRSNVRITSRPKSFQTIGESVLALTGFTISHPGYRKTLRISGFRPRRF